MSIKASPVGIDLGGTYLCVDIFQQHGNGFIQCIEKERKLTSYKAFPDSEHLITSFKSIEDMTIQLGIPVKEVVVSVPACLSEFQRRAIKDASDKAGLNVLHIINQQIAAAVGYCFKKKVRGNLKFLIFEGDVSIFGFEDGKIEMHSTSAGDHHLGREDLDNLMFNSCSSITRDDFEELNADLVRQILDPVVEALRDAKMNKTDIKNVVLLGSWTRIPKVQKLLRDFFEGKTLDFVEFDIVASGAAIICAILKGDSDIGIQFHATFLGNQTCVSIQADAEDLEVIYPSDSGINSAGTGNIPLINQKALFKAIHAQSTDVPSTHGLLPSCRSNLVLTDQLMDKADETQIKKSNNEVPSAIQARSSGLSAGNIGDGNENPMDEADETQMKSNNEVPSTIQASSSGLSAGNIGDGNENPMDEADETQMKSNNEVPSTIQASSSGLSTGNIGDGNENLMDKADETQIKKSNNEVPSAIQASSSGLSAGNIGDGNENPMDEADETQMKSNNEVPSTIQASSSGLSAGNIGDGNENLMDKADETQIKKSNNEVPSAIQASSSGLSAGNIGDGNENPMDEADETQMKSNNEVPSTIQASSSGLSAGNIGDGNENPMDEADETQMKSNNEVPSTIQASSSGLSAGNIGDGNENALTGTNQELPGQPADRIPFIHGQPADARPRWPAFFDLGLFPSQPDQPSNVVADAESELARANDEKDLDRI